MSVQTRQPVVVVLGHVDSGKTSLLDKIRGTAVQAREAGGITQHIGASFFPTETLSRICGPLLSMMKGEIRLPGLLVIDTPGHQVFANLRTRGGSAADIAILVVDINRGFEVQTHESVEILKSRRVPFVVALNKLDMLSGWRSRIGGHLVESISRQEKAVADLLDTKIYDVLGVLSRLGFESEAFHRISDFTRQIAIVPVSARTGEGIPELLAVLLGLSQHYLTKKLGLKAGPARGIVLEIKEEVGLGLTANVILLDGVLRTQDQVVLGRRDGPLLTRVKAMFMPKPLDEMRDPRDKFTSVEEVHAAAGVKIITPDLTDVLAGGPILGVDGERSIEEAVKLVESEVKGLILQTEKMGVVLKTDTLGSLEALTTLLGRDEIPLRIADIGPVTHRDVVEASTVRDQDDLLGVVLAFNVKVLQDAQQEAELRNVRIFSDQVIYELTGRYLEWVQQTREERIRKGMQALTPLSKFRFLKGLVFRRSGPAIFGIEVLEGRIRQKMSVMNSEGERVGEIHQIQDQKKILSEAEKGAELAISMKAPQVGRHVFEGDVYYSLPAEDEIKAYRERYLERLTQEERGLLEEIVRVRRKSSQFYGYGF